MKHTLQIVGSRVYSEGIHPRVNPFGVYESATCTRGIQPENLCWLVANQPKVMERDAIQVA